MSNFQIAVVGFFLFFMIVGIIVFATFGGFGGGAVAQPQVVIWGTLDQTAISGVINNINAASKNSLNVKYVQKDASTFDNDFINALASGNGPDAILLPQDEIMNQKDKITVIPFTDYPERTFKDTFIQEGDLYRTDSGYVGIPFAIDPLVMYYNRTILNSAGVSIPPAHWEELTADAPKLTVKSDGSNIQTSAISIGEYQNVAHAKQILSTLILQAGDPITIINQDSSSTDIVLDEAGAQDSAPAVSALNFYTEFANPSKPDYSWNRSLPNSTDAFIAGDTALYLGFASELNNLRNKNPNLNFDVTELPQIQATTAPLTFGNMYALAILKNSKNPSWALKDIMTLTGNDAQGQLDTALNLPPVRRDLLATPPQDPSLSVFYSSALISSAFLDPNPQESDGVFQTMIESVTGGSKMASEAISNAQEELRNLLPQTQIQ